MHSSKILIKYLIGYIVHFFQIQYSSDFLRRCHKQYFFSHNNKGNPEYWRYFGNEYLTKHDTQKYQDQIDYTYIDKIVYYAN